MRETITSVGDGMSVADQRMDFVSTETWTSAILMTGRIDIPRGIRRCLAACCSSDSVPWSMAPQAQKLLGESPPQNAVNPPAPPSAVIAFLPPERPAVMQVPPSPCEVAVKAVVLLGLLFGKTA